MKSRNYAGRAIAIAIAAVTFHQVALAQQKPDDAIKNRQATFNVIAGHIGKIKTNLDGEYNHEQVLKSVTAIQAIANADIASLFIAGTDKGTGYHETQLKADAFNPDNAKKFKDAVNNFVEQSNQLAVITAIGDKAAVQAQFGKLRGTCKSCHDNFRVDTTAK